MGDVQSAMRMGSPQIDQAYNVVADGSGNVYLTGYYSDNADFGSYILHSSGLGDVFIAKLQE